MFVVGQLQDRSVLLRQRWECLSGSPDGLGLREVLGGGGAGRSATKQARDGIDVGEEAQGRDETRDDQVGEEEEQRQGERGEEGTWGNVDVEQCDVIVDRY